MPSRIGKASRSARADQLLRGLVVLQRALADRADQDLKQIGCPRNRSSSQSSSAGSGTASTCSATQRCRTAGGMSRHFTASFSVMTIQSPGGRAISAGVEVRVVGKRQVRRGDPEPLQRREEPLRRTGARDRRHRARARVGREVPGAPAACVAEPDERGGHDVNRNTLGRAPEPGPPAPGGSGSPGNASAPGERRAPQPSSASGRSRASTPLSATASIARSPPAARAADHWAGTGRCPRRARRTPPVPGSAAGPRAAVRRRDSTTSQSACRRSRSSAAARSTPTATGRRAALCDQDRLVAKGRGGIGAGVEVHHRGLATGAAIAPREYARPPAALLERLDQGDQQRRLAGAADHEVADDHHRRDARGLRTPLAGRDPLATRGGDLRDQPLGGPQQARQQAVGGTVRREPQPVEPPFEPATGRLRRGRKACWAAGHDAAGR